MMLCSRSRRETSVGSRVAIGDCDGFMVGSSLGRVDAAAGLQGAGAASAAPSRPECLDDPFPGVRDEFNDARHLGIRRARRDQSQHPGNLNPAGAVCHSLSMAAR